MTRVAMYVRVPTDGQERDGTSLASQEQAYRQFAERAGWSVAAVVRDTASGYSLDRRGREQFRGMVRQGGVDVMLPYAADRLSRNQNHIGVLFNELPTANRRPQHVHWEATTWAGRGTPRCQRPFFVSFVSFVGAQAAGRGRGDVWLGRSDSGWDGNAASVCRCHPDFGTKQTRKTKKALRSSPGAPDPTQCEPRVDRSRASSEYCHSVNICTIPCGLCYPVGMEGMAFYTIEEAAAALGLDASTLRRRISRGDMQAHRAGARVLLIPADDVERWRKRGKLKPGRKPKHRPSAS